MNYNELWDAELALSSLRATQWIYLCGLEHSLRIYGFRLTWPCLIVEFLAALTKFLKISSCFTVINCSFHTSNVLVASMTLWPSMNSLSKVPEFNFVANLSVQLSSHTFTFVCLLPLFKHLSFLISSHINFSKKNKDFCTEHTLIIQYRYTDQIQ